MPDTGNGYNGAELARFLSEIDTLDDELASLKGDYMQRCKGPRSGIKNVMAEVKDSGFNVVSFREALKDHRYERAREARIAALEDDDATKYEMIIEALGDFGDTPLGKAAIDRKRPRHDGDQTLNTL